MTEPITQSSVYDDFPKLPRLWVGYALAGAFLIGEILTADETGVNGVLLVIAVVAWCYWLFCVSRFHEVVNRLAMPLSTSEPGFLSSLQDSAYPTSAQAAVLRHFIPLYNFYWICKWPIDMASFINAKTSVRMISGVVLGLGLLFSVLLRAVDGFLGILAMFAIGSYIAAKLRRVLAERRDGGTAAEVFA